MRAHTKTHTETQSPWEWFRTQLPPSLLVREGKLLVVIHRDLGAINVMVRVCHPSLECDTCTAGWFGPLSFYSKHNLKVNLIFFPWKKSQHLWHSFMQGFLFAVVTNSATLPESCLCAVLLGNSWHSWISRNIWTSACNRILQKKPAHFHSLFTPHTILRQQRPFI